MNVPISMRKHFCHILKSILLVILISRSGWAFELSGTVVDSKDIPLEKVSVWFRQLEKVLKTESDIHGAFSFTNLAVAPTEIVAWKDGMAIAGITTVFPGSIPVKLRLHEATTLTVSLLSPSGLPVPDARVKSLWVSDTFHVYAEEFRSAGFPVPRSDEAGNLVIPWVTKDSFINLIVAHNDFAETAGFWLIPGQKTQIIQMAPGFRLTGRVTAEGSDKGLPSAYICTVRKDTKGIARSAEAKTDKEGFFSLMLPRGEYEISATHKDYPYLPTQQATLSRDNTETTVDFRFPVCGWVKGRVIFTGEKPIPAVPVALVSKDRLVGEAFTQEDGVFRIPAPQERVAVKAVSPRGLMPARNADIFAEASAEKTVEVKDLEFKEIPAVTGKVMPVETSAEQRVLVSTMNSQIPCWAICDKEGKFVFRLPQVPPDGKLKIRAEHAQRFLRKDVELAFDAPSATEITLEPFEPNLVQDNSNATQSGQTQEDPLLALLDKPAPALECDPWFNSSSVKLEDLRGKVIVLAFLGAFDTAGQATMAVEELRALYDLYKGLEDVVFLAVLDPAITLADMDRWVRVSGIQFPVGRDKDLGTTFTRYSIKNVPRVLLLNKRGEVAYIQTQGRLPELIKDIRRK